MIDLVFGLMFDTLWLSPYDRRRQEGAFVHFERCARRMAMELRSLNAAEMSENKTENIGRVAAELAGSVERLRSEGVVSPEIGILASEQVRKLIEALGTVFTDAETPSR